MPFNCMSGPRFISKLTLSIFISPIDRCMLLLWVDETLFNIITADNNDNILYFVLTIFCVQTTADIRLSERYYTACNKSMRSIRCRCVCRILLQTIRLKLSMLNKDQDFIKKLLALIRGRYNTVTK